MQAWSVAIHIFVHILKMKYISYRSHSRWTFSSMPLALSMGRDLQSWTLCAWPSWTQWWIPGYTFCFGRRSFYLWSLLWNVWPEGNFIWKRGWWDFQKLVIQTKRLPLLERRPPQTHSMQQWQRHQTMGEFTKDDPMKCLHVIQPTLWKMFLKPTNFQYIAFHVI